MAQSNLGKNTSQPIPNGKPVLDKNTGVYIFIDEDGNVKQITKEKKSVKKYFPNEPSKVEEILGDVCVIGIMYDNEEVLKDPFWSPPVGECAPGIAMGVGEPEVMAYAKYS